MCKIFNRHLPGTSPGGERLFFSDPAMLLQGPCPAELALQAL